MHSAHETAPMVGQQGNAIVFGPGASDKPCDMDAQQKEDWPVLKTGGLGPGTVNSTLTTWSGAGCAGTE